MGAADRNRLLVARRADGRILDRLPCRAGNRKTGSVEETGDESCIEARPGVEEHLPATKTQLQQRFLSTEDLNLGPGEPFRVPSLRPQPQFTVDLSELDLADSRSKQFGLE
jgi:hypothetical protein